MKPTTFDQYMGQDVVKLQLKIAINAALKLNTPLPHILLEGRPGLGKTTLAQCIANEQGSIFHEALGLNIRTKQDLIGILSRISTPPTFADGSFDLRQYVPDVLFIDEIHGITQEIEESLYLAMTDFELNYEMVYEGEHYDTVWIPPFTLVGATTMEGLLSPPLLRRFGLHFRLEKYDTEQLVSIIINFCHSNEIMVMPEGAEAIARRCRGSASYANTYTLRCRDYALTFSDDGIITGALAEDNFKLMGINELGLKDVDYKVLIALYQQGRPLGVSALLDLVDVDKSTYERNIEPFLVEGGFIVRTTRGRIIGPNGIQALGIK